MSATTIFAVIQIILYALGVMKVNGNFIDTGKNSDWILLFVSIASCYIGFIGVIILLRGGLSFVYWLSITNLLALTMQVLATMWFAALVSLYLFIMLWIRYYVWKYDYLEKWGWSSQQVATLAISVLITLLIAFNCLVAIAGDWMYQSSEWMTTKNYYLDATNAAICMCAAIFMLFKSRWGFFFYAMSKGFVVINYYDAGLIVPIVQMALFLVTDVTGFIGWSLHSIDEEELSRETMIEL